MKPVSLPFQLRSASGFSGIIPAYIVVLRKLYPAEQAAWRIPFWFFCNIIGMAIGAWLAGYTYDQLGTYAPAFLFGFVLNIANIAVIWGLAAIGLERRVAAMGR